MALAFIEREERLEPLGEGVERLRQLVAQEVIPIEEGVPATARPGGPTGRPGVTPTAPPTGILPSQPSKTAPR